MIKTSNFFEVISKAIYDKSQKKISHIPRNI